MIADYGRGAKRPFICLEVETMENPGWRALAAAIIKQAYRDHAWNFFHTAWCDELLDYVGIGMNGRDVLRMVRGGNDDGKR